MKGYTFRIKYDKMNYTPQNQSKTGEFTMKFSYKKLWKLLIDRDIKYKDLIEKMGISRSTFYKLKKDENVTTDVLLKICEFLQCDVSEIMECIEKETKN